MKPYLFGLLFILVLTCCTDPSNDQISIQGTLQKWNKVTLVLDGPATSETAENNPFLNYRLEATFSQGDKSYVVPGYFAADGDAANTSASEGNKWKIHFRPNEEGEWSYKISFRTGENIALSTAQDFGEPVEGDALEGRFRVGASQASGRDFKAHGRIINAGKGYYRFADSGELFIKNGADSPENFLAFYEFDQTQRFVNEEKRSGEDNPEEPVHQYLPHSKDWKEGDPSWADGKGKNIIGAVNYLADQGMNSIYMLTMNIQGDGKDVWPYTSHEERFRFDCSKLDQWAIVFDHMENLGVMNHFVLQETENETLLDNGDTGDQRKIYLRELTARFGHYLGVIWNLGEENGAAEWTPVAQNDQQRKDMASYIKAINPFQPNVVLHTHSDDGHQDEYLNPLLGFKDLDGPSMQIARPFRINQRIDTFIQRSIKGGKRWIVAMDELGHFSKGLVPDEFSPQHDTMRAQALWGALMAGAAGVEWYFGYKYPHSDLQLEDFRSRHNWWQQSTIATQFISEYPVEEMLASNQLIKGDTAFCFAKEGELYLLYLPIATDEVELELGEDGPFTLAWFNPREGGALSSKASKISGPMVTLSKSEEQKGKDWVAVIRKE